MSKHGQVSFRTDQGGFRFRQDLFDIGFGRNFQQPQTFGGYLDDSQLGDNEIDTA
jgi:hypothetical protein